MRWLALLFLVGVSCSPVSKRALIKSLRAHEEKFQHHAGFVLYDVKKGKTIAYHGDRYFTPASNVKVLTFFSSLSLLGDSLRSLRYQYAGDSLIFWGAADPSFLFSKTCSDNGVITFLKEAAKTKTLYYSPANFQTTALGRGWAWDDFNDYYYAERSALPMYGNCVNFSVSNNRYALTPDKFQVYFHPKTSVKTKVLRETSGLYDKYEIYSAPDTKLTAFEIPFTTSAEVTASLLSDTLHAKVGVTNQSVKGKTLLLKSVPADSVYKIMMKESDNFIAEHLLLQCADMVSDTLQPEIAIAYVQQKLLHDLPDRLVWVDGSGLSRYNLVTPRSIVDVWKKIYRMVPQQRLFHLLASGGGHGTLKNYFKNDQPYIFGKTGTLSNNHALSGYLLTKKGNLYIFAYMNSHYVSSTKDVRLAMESFLNTIYEKR